MTSSKSAPVGQAKVVGESTSSPFFSVGLTTFDRIDLLNQSVASILNQTFAGFELIICNDNPARVLTLADIDSNDPRVRIVNHTENRGQVGSWRSLLEHATGRYFTWIADDDLYAPDFLQASHATLAAHRFPACVYSGFEVFSQTGEMALAPAFSGRSTVSSGLDLLSRYLRDEVGLLGNMGFFDREFLAAQTPWQDMQCPGIALFREYVFVVLAARLDRVAYIPDALIYYRDHPGSWGSSNAQINEYYLAGKWLVAQSASMLRDIVPAELHEQLVMLVFNLVLKQIVSKRKNAFFPIDVEALYNSFVGTPEIVGGEDGSDQAAARLAEERTAWLSLFRQYVAAETGRIEKESVIRTQHDALDKARDEQQMLAKGLEEKERVIQAQHDALQTAANEHRLITRSLEEKESVVNALRDAVEKAENSSRALLKNLEEKEAVVQTLHRAIEGAESNFRLLSKGLEEKEASIQAQSAALKRAEDDARRLTNALEEKEGVVQALHKAVESADNNHRLLARNLEEKEAVVQTLHKALEANVNDRRLLAKGLEEKEAAIQAQSTALKNAEDDRRRLADALQEKEAAIHAVHKAADEAANNHRLAIKGLEEKEAVVQGLHVALEEAQGAFRRLTSGLEEKEAMIQAQSAALKKAEDDTRRLLDDLQEKEGVVKALHRSIDSAEDSRRLLARSLEQKEAVVQTLHKTLEGHETERRLWARNFEEKEATLQSQVAALKQAQDDRDELGRRLEEMQSQVRALQASIEEAENNLRLANQELEDKQVIVGDLNDARAQHQVFARSLEEKEAIIRDLSKAVEAYRSAFSVVGFVIRPANRIVARTRAARERLEQILTPRLGRLYQYPPQPMRLPAHYARPAKVSKPPKISIVTPSFRQARFIERTIESIVGQGYPNLEYFIQDGGSNDGTVEILQRYADKLAGWESRPDRGQSEAINLAFARTSGEIMAWVNSDDIILPGALAYVATYFRKHPDVDVVYGHRILIDESDRQIGRWLMPAHSDDVLSWADYVPQETLFWRRRIWEKVGARVDESFRFAMDWDLLVRFREAGAQFRRLPRFLGAFRIHEHQKTSASINEIGIQEMNRIRERLLGRVPTHDEVGRSVQPYLKKHLALDLFYRVKARLRAYG